MRAALGVDGNDVGDGIAEALLVGALRLTQKTSLGGLVEAIRKKGGTLVGRRTTNSGITLRSQTKKVQRGRYNGSGGRHASTRAANTYQVDESIAVRKRHRAAIACMRNSIVKMKLAAVNVANSNYSQSIRRKISCHVTWAAT